MEKKIAKKLLIKTIIVIIFIFVIMWLIAVYVHPLIIESESMVGYVLYIIFGIIILFCLVVCYQFAKEYFHIIHKSK